MNNYNLLFKFIVIGDTNVGKSSVLLQFLENKFRQEYDPTIGVEFGSKIINIQDKNIKLQIWDTAGQESFRSITRSYYRSSIGALLVFDITDKNTFESVQKWLDEVKSHANDKIQIILIGNKKDLEDQFVIQLSERRVSYQEAEEYANSQNLQFMETSAKTGYNITDAFMALSETIFNQLEKGDINPMDDSYGIKVGKNSQQNLNSRSSKSSFSKQKCC